jgi:hypothetical protein
MAQYTVVIVKRSGRDLLERLKTPFYLWQVKCNRSLLFILYSGMANLSDESLTANTKNTH